MKYNGVYRTVFEVVVYSEGPADFAGCDLDEIYYAISEGDCIGDFRQVSQEPMPPEQVHAALVKIGNDGNFFDYLAEEDEGDVSSLENRADPTLHTENTVSVTQRDNTN